MAESRIAVLPRFPLPGIRGGLLAAFLIALAVSISASQVLLALLFAVAVPWSRLARAAVGPEGLRGAARELATAAGGVRDHPLTPPFAAFAGLTLLSALVSGDPGWSLWLSRDLLRIAVFYLVLGSTRDADHAFRVWQGFLVALTLMACYGLAQAWFCRVPPAILTEPWRSEICVHPSRVSGPFSIYMTFGGVLLLGALFLLAHLANVRWRDVAWMVPAGLVMVVALALTYSRNAWLGLIVGALVLVLTGQRAGRTLLALALLALVAAAVSPPTVWQRARSAVDLRDETARDRVAMWRSGLGMIADHPVFGVGPGQVRAWYAHYRRPEAVRPSTGHLHNSPIHIAAERGLPALAAWVWLWVVFFRHAGRILCRLDPDRARARALVCASLSGIAGFLVAGLFEHNFGDAEVVMLVYALMTLPFVVARPATDGSG
jgi:O-antigen ligase